MDEQGRTQILLEQVLSEVQTTNEYVRQLGEDVGVLMTDVAELKLDMGVVKGDLAAVKGRCSRAFGRSEGDQATRRRTRGVDHRVEGRQPLAPTAVHDRIFTQELMDKVDATLQLARQLAPDTAEIKGRPATSVAQVPTPSAPPDEPGSGCQQTAADASGHMLEVRVR